MSSCHDPKALETILVDTHNHKNGPVYSFDHGEQPSAYQLSHSQLLHGKCHSLKVVIMAT